MRNSRDRMALYLTIVVAGLLFALPNVLPASVLERWPSVLPDKSVALGLDLRGGSHLVLEVDGAELRRRAERRSPQGPALSRGPRASAPLMPWASGHR